jgi:type I restriction enzyme M protein
MSSQASSAGHGEKDVRERIVRTGDVDVMMSIRVNFFYTRTVPCELWFFDRGKPETQREHVLMIDARNVYRKVNRTINDFAPEQMANLSSIVWLYRGQKDRFIGLVQLYLHSINIETQSCEATLQTLESTLDSVNEKMAAFVELLKKCDLVSDVEKEPIKAAVKELLDTNLAYRKDRPVLTKDLAVYRKSKNEKPPATTKPQQAAIAGFNPLAERIRGLVKQIDLICKLASRISPLIVTLLSEASDEVKDALPFDRRTVSRELKQLDDVRKSAIEQLRRGVYFHRQATWLLERFPDSKLVDIPGLVKLVSLAEIEAADWSLTPGRYVGVAPDEVDEDFDFEQTMHDIHVELADLNAEAIDLATKIQENYEEMGL